MFCESDAKSYGCETFTCALRVMCYRVISASAYTSAEPLSLKQNGVFTFDITPDYTDSHTAHSTHNTDHDEAKKTEEAFHDLERDEVQLVA